MGKQTEAKVAAVQVAVHRYESAHGEWQRAKPSYEAEARVRNAAQEAEQSYAYSHWVEGRVVGAPGQTREQLMGQDATYIKLCDDNVAAWKRANACEAEMAKANKLRLDAKTAALRAIPDLETFIATKEKKMTGGKKSLPLAKKFVVMARAGMA